MPYNAKINVRVTDDGIKSWLQWDGEALRAYAEKVSEDRRFKSARYRIVPPLNALVRYFGPKDRAVTTPENFARWQVERQVREDWETYVAERNPLHMSPAEKTLTTKPTRGTEGPLLNGGW